MKKTIALLFAVLVFLLSSCKPVETEPETEDATTVDQTEVVDADTTQVEAVVEE
ncbi:MAG: hypothetical protein WC466_02140 [Candidatus Izemoplasmatales bacterium]